MAIRNERRNARARACGSGAKPCSEITSLTFARVSSRTSGESLMTRDTVFFETFASRAMSLIVTLALSRAWRRARALDLSFVTRSSCKNVGSGPRSLRAAVERIGRSRHHRREVPFRLVERPARRRHGGVASDLGLAVDDLATTFGYVGENPRVVRVAVPRPRAGVLEDPGLHIDGRQRLKPGGPVERLAMLDDARRGRRVAAEHRQRPPEPIDGHVVA